jgi:4-oxalocrotonate tautomerase
MPIVRINMFEGRSLSKKRYMADEISKIVAEVCDVDQAGVHVLFEEVSRDNWARGGTLHRDRGPKYPQESSFQRTSFRSISTVKVKPGIEERYIAYRSEHVNPAMATMKGFIGTLTLRDLAARDTFLIINTWDSEQAWRDYQSTTEHDALKATIRGDLVEEMVIHRYSTVDLPLSSGLDDEASPHKYFTVSTHRLKTDNSELYLHLRTAAVHPSMAKFHGFVSSNALESLDEQYAFLIVNSWESQEAANTYSSDQSHYALRDQVRSILSEHSGTRQYELVR